MRTQTRIVLMAALCFALTGCGGGNSAAPPTRVAFSSYAGNWTGSWHNLTFGTTGLATLAVSLNPAGTAITWTITLQGNVFGSAAPQPETLTGVVTANNITLTGQTMTFGQVTLSIDAFGNVTGSGINIQSPNVSRIDFSGTWTAHSLNLTYTLTLRSGGTATGVYALVKP